ncbi:hypothetical protein TCSYLVIO_000877 [Trypanosoma cruzi]|nr:hypothetical protein TCSYLVIO_000877 [Trypanosoma cruzi]
MLHFIPAKASLRCGGDGKSCLSIPPAWLQGSSKSSTFSSTCSPRFYSPGACTMGSASMQMEQGCEIPPGFYFERLVGMEFIGSSYTLGSLQEAVLAFIRSEQMGALDAAALEAASASSPSSSAGELDGGEGGETLSVVYFMVLLVASCNGKDTSIEAVRCAFYGPDDAQDETHSSRLPGEDAKEKESPPFLKLEAEYTDRDPDLLLQYLWDQLHSETQPMWCGAGCTVPFPTTGSTSSSFQIIDRTLLLLRAGVLDIVQASLTMSPSCMPTLTGTTVATVQRKRRRRRGGMTEKEKGVRESMKQPAFSALTTVLDGNSHNNTVGELGFFQLCAEVPKAFHHGLMLSFTERLDARLASVAMPDGGRQHERRSFASLRRFLQRQQKQMDTAAASASASVTSAFFSNRRTFPMNNTSPPFSVAEEALSLAPYRYFVWLHVVGTDIFYEATVTEKISVPLPARQKCAPTAAAPAAASVFKRSKSATSHSSCSGTRESAAMCPEEASVRGVEEEERIEEEDGPLGRPPSSLPALLPVSVGHDDTPLCDEAKIAVMSLPANAFCQMGYFLKRKKTDLVKEKKGRKLITTFHWISACDYAKQGLQVKEVSYVQDGDTKNTPGAFFFAELKGGKRHQKNARRQEERSMGSSASAGAGRFGTLEVRSAAQWSLAHYPQWHHWDPVTQRLSFWAAFQTYDKLRIVVFNGHPDRRCCEFERNLPRRRQTVSFSSTTATPSYHTRHDDAADAAMTMQVAVERGFGVSGSSCDVHRSAALGGGATLLEPWGTACCSALSRIHMNLLPVQYEDGIRDSVLCEQLFLSRVSYPVPSCTLPLAVVEVSTETSKWGLDTSPRVSTSATNGIDDRNDRSVREHNPLKLRPDGDVHFGMSRYDTKLSSGEEVPLPTRPRTAVTPASTIEIGPPVILCMITALRNQVDAVKVTIPLTYEERCRVTYDTRVTFLFMKGMIVIYLPGVFVHYVDLHHKDTPPRYLFGVQLNHPASLRREALFTMINTNVTATSAPTPLVTYLPVPFGHWLYVPGTAMLFEVSLHPSAVWEFIRRLLIRRRLCRERASELFTTGVFSPSQGREGEEEGKNDGNCYINDGSIVQYFGWSCQTSDSPSLGERIQTQRASPAPYVLPTAQDDTLMDPAVFATFLQPAPLYSALHVALTHLKPSREGDDDHFIPSSPLSSSSPSCRHETASRSNTRSQLLASSRLGWEEVWAARDAQLEKIFSTYLSMDIWREISVELISTLVISEAYERTRAACRWPLVQVWKKEMTEDGTSRRDTSTFNTTSVGVCNPCYVYLPIWDPAGLGAEEVHYRREVVSFYSAWRQLQQQRQKNHQQREQQQQYEEEEAEMMPATSIGGVSCHYGLGSEYTGCVREKSVPLGVNIAPSSPLSTPTLTRETTPGIHSASVSESPSHWPKRNPPCAFSDPFKSNTVFSFVASPRFMMRSMERSTRQNRRQIEGGKKAAILSSLLVHSMSFRGAVVAKQQCHNTLPEWWVVHGICTHPTPSRLLRKAPHLQLLFTSYYTLDDDTNSKGTSLLHWIKDTFRNNQGNHSPSVTANAMRSAPSCALVSLAPVGRISLPAFSPVALVGNETIASSSNENVSLCNNNNNNNNNNNGSSSSSSNNNNNSNSFVRDIHIATNPTSHLSSTNPRVSAGSSLRKGIWRSDNYFVKFSYATPPHAQTTESSGGGTPHTGSAAAYAASQSPPFVGLPSFERVKRVPFDGLSCGMPFLEAVLEQLRVLLKACPNGHASRLSSAGMQRSMEQESQRQHHVGGSRPRSSETVGESRFLTPAFESLFASLLTACATSAPGTAPYLELLALFYDAAVASVVNALVRITNAPLSSSLANSPAEASLTLNPALGCVEGDSKAVRDSSEVLLTRWVFGQRLALALERLGMPPSSDLVEYIAREGLHHFPTRTFIAGQSCGAFDGVGLASLLRQQPSLGSLLHEQVVSFAPRLSHDLGLFSLHASRVMREFATPTDETVLSEAIQKALCCGVTTDRTAAKPSHSSTGYSDSVSPILALQPSYAPHFQRRMLFSHLVMNTSMTPQQVALEGNVTMGTFSQSSMLCEQKRQVMAALDPGPYIQQGDERSIPLETEFVSSFLPFQWWWKQKRRHMNLPIAMNIGDNRNTCTNSKISNSKPFLTNASKTASTIPVFSCTPFSTSTVTNTSACSRVYKGPDSMKATEFSRMAKAEECVNEVRHEIAPFVATPLSFSTDINFPKLLRSPTQASFAGPTKDGRQEPDMLKGTLSLLTLTEADLERHDTGDSGLFRTQEEMEENKAAIAVMAILPKMLAATPLGRMVAMGRAKAAMAVVLDPFFKED